jgi:hypothetical protein
MISSAFVTADSLGAQGTVIVTFAAAAAGSFLAVAAQAWITRRGSQAYFRSLVDALSDELDSISEQVTERSERGPADLRLDAPYPTSAWQTLVRSAEVRRLGDAYAPLARFYASVDGANHRTAQVTTLLQVSATAADDQLRLSYRELAQQFSGPSHSEVLAALPGANQAIAEARS